MSWHPYLLAVLAFLVSVCASLVAATDYTTPLAIALLFAMLHFRCVWLCIHRGHARARYALLLLSIPVAVLTVDNLARMSSILGGS